MIIKGRVISKKNNKRIFYMHGKIVVIPSKSFQVFKESCLWQLKGQKKYHGPLSIKIEFRMKGKMDSDIDNMCTSIFDILADAEILENDKDIVELHAIKKEGYTDFETTIEITEIVPKLTP